MNQTQRIAEMTEDLRAALQSRKFVEDVAKDMVELGYVRCSDQTNDTMQVIAKQYYFDHEGWLCEETHYYCPNCGYGFNRVEFGHCGKNYCSECGQKLDWSVLKNGKRK